MESRIPTHPLCQNKVSPRWKLLSLQRSRRNADRISSRTVHDGQYPVQVHRLLRRLVDHRHFVPHWRQHCINYSVGVSFRLERGNLRRSEPERYDRNAYPRDPNDLYRKTRSVVISIQSPAQSIQGAKLRLRNEQTGASFRRRYRYLSGGCLCRYLSAVLLDVGRSRYEDSFCREICMGERKRQRIIHRIGQNGTQIANKLFFQSEPDIAVLFCKYPNYERNRQICNHLLLCPQFFQQHGKSKVLGESYGDLFI